MPLLRTPTEAIAWANAQDKWAPHSCLNFVKNAYYGPTLPTQNALDGKPFLDEAHVGWDNSTDKHFDRNPPVGALMYFAGAQPGDPGDVQLYIGNGQTRRTDVGAWGVVGTVDAFWMERVVGRKYLGWTGDILGLSYFDAKPVTPHVQEVVISTPVRKKIVEIIETNGDIWIVDHGQRTRWNIITGLSTVDAAMGRLKWLRAQGYKFYPGQPASKLAGYKII